MTSEAEIQVERRLDLACRGRRVVIVLAGYRTRVMGRSSGYT